MPASQADFDVNVIGLLRVTRAVLPVMRQGGRSHVINLSSMAGLVTGEGTGIYGATKFAVEAISEALRASSGNQPGDPDKAARIICDIVASPTVPASGKPPYAGLAGGHAAG